MIILEKTQRQKGEYYLKMEAEMVVTSQMPRVVGNTGHKRKKWNRFSFRTFRGSTGLGTP